jgi:phage terminase large subunit
MDRSIVRIASVKTWTLKKRCRNKKWVFLEGQGETTQDALYKLEKSFKKLIEESKEVELKGQIIVFDGECWRGMVSRPLMPEISGTNLEVFPTCILFDSVR